MRPTSNDYASFYASYVARVPEEDVIAALEKQGRETAALFREIDDTKAGYRYADGKWSVKEVVGHLTDAERVFAFRTLAFARGDESPLPGFDEETYVRNAEFDRQPMSLVVEQYEVGRRSTLLLLKSLQQSDWEKRGVANDAEVSVRALAYIIVGHERHHLSVLRERYGL